MGPNIRGELTLHENGTKKLQNEVEVFLSPALLDLKGIDFVGLSLLISSMIPAQSPSPIVTM